MRNSDLVSIIHSRHTPLPEVLGVGDAREVPALSICEISLRVREFTYESLTPSSATPETIKVEVSGLYKAARVENRN